MKLIASRKKSITPTDVDPAHFINSGFGTTFKAMPDGEVSKFIEDQAVRGYICFEFDHTGTYHSQTTVIKTQVA